MCLPWRDLIVSFKLLQLACSFEHNQGFPDWVLNNGLVNIPGDGERLECEEKDSYRQRENV